MSKWSTKLVSFALAVVMLVSMVPMMAFAEEALPVLTSLTPDASMDIKSASVNGNTYTYKVGYWNQNFKFKIAYEAGATAVVKTNIGAEISAVSGAYTLPLRQYSEYTYYIVLTKGGVSNTYTLKLQRLYNSEVAINGITGTGFAVTKNGNTFILDGNEEGKAISFGLDLSVGAAAVIRNDLGQIVSAKNGVYTINKNENLTVKVTAHDGKASEDWKINITISKGNEDTTLSKIDDAVWDGSKYVANIAYNTFLVNATVPAGATYTLYSDASCYRPIKNRNLTLTAAQTTVYIVVTASNGQTKSEPVKLVINTTADPADNDAQEPMQWGGTDKLYLMGGFFASIDHIDGINVFLPAGTKTFKVEAKVLGLGYDLAIYGDPHKVAFVPNNTTISLNNGETRLYAYLNNGKEEIMVPIVIMAPVYVDFTDEQASWAEDAIFNIAYRGEGLMKGDDQGRFNGTKTLTRSEMAVILCGLKGINASLYKNVANPFGDQIDSWAINFAKAAWNNQLMSGVSVGDQIQFQGKKEATRSEFYLSALNAKLGDVKAYYQENKEVIDNYVKAKNFKDASQTAEWAKPGIYTAVYLGLASGDSQGKINPNGKITRNEVAVILNKLIEM